MPVSFSQLNAKHFPLVKDVLTWAAPAILIPTLRYFQDPPEQRKELFLRDASTYSVGAALYLGVGLLGKKLLESWKIFKTPGTRDLVAFLAALTVNILYAGIGALHFSRRFSKKHHLADPSFNTTVPPLPADKPIDPPLYFSQFKRIQYLA